MTHDDDEPPASDQEQREAAELAASLERRARAPESLPPALEAAVMARVAPLLDARRASHRRRWILATSLGGAAAAAAFALLLSSQRMSAPRFAATVPPAPPADLLAAQARAARGRDAIAALDVEMRSYRRHYHDELRRRRGRGAP